MVTVIDQDKPPSPKKRKVLCLTVPPNELPPISLNFVGGPKVLTQTKLTPIQVEYLASAKSITIHENIGAIETIAG